MTETHDNVPPPGWQVLRADGFTVSSDRARLDFDFIHAGLAASYWSPGIARELVEKAARHSVPFGLYAPEGAQAGYCRIITDQTSFAYLADVWIDPARRGLGLGKFLVGSVTGIPQWRDLRRWMLVTADAQGLYRQYGFTAPRQPERLMERLRAMA